jgi:1-acyl-sn-glycerol-3-phosphate acyltransferase
VQDELLKAPLLGPFFWRFGGFPASWLRQPDALHHAMQVLCVYPEGTEGNCKPFWQAYQMVEWRTGFLKLALARKAKIVPTAVIGGEESFPVAATIRFLKPFIGTILPLPLSMLPLPTTWKFIAHKPVSLDGLGLDAPDLDPAAQKRQLHAIADSIRTTVQRTLDRETADRGLVRFGGLLRRAAEVPGLVAPRVPAPPPLRVEGRVVSSPAASL